MPLAPGPLIPSKGRQSQVCAPFQPGSTTGRGVSIKSHFGDVFQLFLSGGYFLGEPTGQSRVWSSWQPSLRIQAFPAVARGQPLVRELRSRKLHGAPLPKGLLV